MVPKQGLLKSHPKVGKQGVECGTGINHEIPCSQGNPEMSREE